MVVCAQVKRVEPKKRTTRGARILTALDVALSQKSELSDGQYREGRMPAQAKLARTIYREWKV